MNFKFFSLQAASILLTIALGGCAVDGCIDPAATNFDPDATRDDGSCLIEGCTDANAPNFNQDANVDDGSCLPIPCPEGEQSILTVVNESICNRDITLNGDTISFQLIPGDSVMAELDQGSYTVKAPLPLITLCTPIGSTTIEAVCGESYRWEVFTN